MTRFRNSLHWIVLGSVMNEDPRLSALEWPYMCTNNIQYLLVYFTSQYRTVYSLA